jgi:glycosyltransferase involved in cell wall biosynthesis
MNPRVSVVIPTCGRLQLLGRCLDALDRQRLDPAAFEVIVVDDGRSDPTRKLVQSRAAAAGARRAALRYLRPDGKGPAAARNCGWRAARGEIIAFTDDDTIPDDDWLRQGLMAMAPGLAAVRGSVQVPEPPVVTDHARMTRGLEQAEFVTANCFVRRSVLRQVGGFDERFKRAWREDSDLHFALLSRFGDVPRAPGAIVQHPVREAPWGISIRQQANVMFDALLFKKHPRLYRAKVGRLRAPGIYYGIVAAAFAALAAAAASEPGWAAVSTVVALALVGRLAWRRLQGTSHDPAHVLEMVATSCVIPFLALYWRIVGAMRYRVPFF